MGKSKVGKDCVQAFELDDFEEDEEEEDEDDNFKFNYGGGRVGGEDENKPRIMSKPSKPSNTVKKMKSKTYDDDDDDDDDDDIVISRGRGRDRDRNSSSNIDGGLSIDTAPIINQYKLDFFLRRWPRTILGGVNIFLGKQKQPIPLGIYLIQITFFLLPVIIGILFCLVISSSTAYNDETYDYSYKGSSVILFSLVYGLVQFLGVFILRVVGISIIKRDQDDDDDDDKETGQFGSDEEVYNFEKGHFCSASTFRFLFSDINRSAVTSVMISILSGIAASLSLYYLLPHHFSNSIGFEDSSPLLYIFLFLGWFSFAVSIYSLSVSKPPEPNQFFSHDGFALNCTSRVFYIVFFVILDFIVREVGVARLDTVNRVCHFIFSFLWLLFSVGVVPPFHVGIEWFVEQIHVFALGGAYAASTKRLAKGFLAALVSLMVVLIIYFIPSSISPLVFAIVVSLASVFGYFLSGDILFYLFSKTESRPSCFLEILFALLFGVVSFFLSYLSLKESFGSLDDAKVIFEIVFLVLLISSVLAIELQKRYVFRLFSNFAFFRPKFIKVLVYSMRVIVFVIPIVSLVHISLFAGSFNRGGYSWIHIISIIRATRTLWQRPCIFIQEVCFFIILKYIGLLTMDHGISLELGLLISAFLLDRCKQFIGKCWFVSVSTLTAWV